MSTPISPLSSYVLPSPMGKTPSEDFEKYPLEKIQAQLDAFREMMDAIDYGLFENWMPEKLGIKDENFEFIIAAMIYEKFTPVADVSNEADREKLANLVHSFYMNMMRNTQDGSSST
jgi:hypothetical protein